MPFRSRIWIWLSQGVNSFVLKGIPEESVSARAYREGWYLKVDRWLGQDHCKRVWEDFNKRLRP